MQVKIILDCSLSPRERFPEQLRPTDAQKQNPGGVGQRIGRVAGSGTDCVVHPGREGNLTD